MEVQPISYKKNIFLLILMILTGYIARHHQLMAVYFLGDELFFRFVILISLLIGWFSIFYFFYRFRTKIDSFIFPVSLFLVVFIYFSIHLIYFIRPYTQYITLFIYLSSLITGIFSGTIASFIIQPVSVKVSLNWRMYVAMSAGLILGYWLPVPKNPEITIWGTCVALFLFILLNRPGIKYFGLGELILYGLSIVMIISSILIYEPLILHQSQKQFKDKVVYNKDTGKYDLTITKWKHHYWIYLNGLKQISTIDDYLFYEPFILPVSYMSQELAEVLILGGENGCAARELLKNFDVKSIILVPNDRGMAQIYKTNPVLRQLNNNSLGNKKVNILNQGILEYITSSKKQFDLIIIDLPDPRDIETNQFYTYEFYQYISNLTKNNGLFITQSGSPYFTTEAFRSIEATIRSAGIHTLPLHNQILTLGEWSWIIGSKILDRATLKNGLLNVGIDETKTRWLNYESLKLLTSFGKEYIHIDTIEINTLSKPTTYKYYIDGTWDFD